MDRSRIARLFTHFGYAALLVQLAWLAVLGLPSFLDSGLLDIAHSPQPVPHHVSSPSAVVIPQPILMLIGLITVFSLVIFIAYVIRENSRMVTKVSETATQKLAHVMVPHIVHHKKLPQRKAHVLTLQIQLVLKLAACVLVFALSFSAYLIELPIEPLAAVIIAGLLAPWGIIWFSLAHLITPQDRKRTRRAKLKTKTRDAT